MNQEEMTSALIYLQDQVKRLQERVMIVEGRTRDLDYRTAGSVRLGPGDYTLDELGRENTRRVSELVKAVSERKRE